MAGEVKNRSDRDDLFDLLKADTGHAFFSSTLPVTPQRRPPHRHAHLHLEQSKSANSMVATLVGWYSQRDDVSTAPEDSQTQGTVPQSRRAVYWLDSVLSRVQERRVAAKHSFVAAIHGLLRLHARELLQASDVDILVQDGVTTFRVSYAVGEKDVEEVAERVTELRRRFIAATPDLLKARVRLLIRAED